MIYLMTSHLRQADNTVDRFNPQICQSFMKTFSSGHRRRDASPSFPTKTGWRERGGATGAVSTGTYRGGATDTWYVYSDFTHIHRSHHSKQIIDLCFSFYVDVVIHLFFHVFVCFFYTLTNCITHALLSFVITSLQLYYIYYRIIK